MGNELKSDQGLNNQPKEEQKIDLDHEQNKHFALPIWKLEKLILKTLSDGNNVVVNSPCGSGKTTQIPQMIYYNNEQEKTYVIENRVVITEALGIRVAEELGEKVGDTVGYMTGPGKRVSNRSKIIFVTAGVFKQILRSNPNMEGVSTVIFDEFDERTMLMDIGVAMVDKAQSNGSKVKMMFMSGTIDPKPLEDIFGCKTIQAEGRQYDVDVHYDNKLINESDITMWAADKAIDAVARTESGDILIFMPGKAEIEATIQELKKKSAPLSEELNIIPLHSELQPEERSLAFRPSKNRKIIVSTNMAQRGVTFDGIKYVICSGLERRLAYDESANATKMILAKVAQADILQQIGRAGRTAPGECYLPYTKADFEKLPQATPAEILRLPLPDIVLQLKAMGFSREEDPLRFIDAPAKSQWKAAKKLLKDMGVITEDGTTLTDFGEKVSHFGCGVREAAMIVKAAEYGCVNMALEIAAIRMSRPLCYLPRKKEGEALSMADRRSLAQESRKDIPMSDSSDLLSELNIYHAAKEHINDKGHWLKDHFISYLAVKEIDQNLKKLRQEAIRYGIYTPKDSEFKLSNFCKVLEAGFPDMIYKYYRRFVYENSAGDMIQIGRNSALYSEAPNRIIVTERFNNEKMRYPVATSVTKYPVEEDE